MVGLAHVKVVNEGVTADELSRWISRDKSLADVLCLRQE